MLFNLIGIFVLINPCTFGRKEIKYIDVNAPYCGCIEDPQCYSERIEKRKTINKNNYNDMEYSTIYQCVRHNAIEQYKIPLKKN